MGYNWNCSWDVDMSYCILLYSSFLVTVCYLKCKIKTTVSEWWNGATFKYKRRSTGKTWRWMDEPLNIWWRIPVSYAGTWGSIDPPCLKWVGTRAPPLQCLHSHPLQKQRASNQSECQKHAFPSYTRVERHDRTPHVKGNPTQHPALMLSAVIWAA